MAKRGNPEADAQRAIVRDLHLVLLPPYIVHCSVNEAGKASRTAQAILQGMGVHAGFSDLLLLGPARLVLFLEVKSRTGKPSEDQLAFRDHVKAFGWPYEIVRTSQEAISAAVAHGFRTRIKGALP